MRLQARKLGVQVHTRIEHGLRQVRCDRTMVEQVLLNLSRNGMQAMDSPGCEPRLLRMDVRLANAQGDAAAGRAWVEFAVTDWGVGISGEVAQQLYTPFFTTKDEGMGLGLSLCRTVVEQHGSHLVHHDNSPQGTIFSLSLIHI